MSFQPSYDGRASAQASSGNAVPVPNRPLFPAILQGFEELEKMATLLADQAQAVADALFGPEPKAIADEQVKGGAESHTAAITASQEILRLRLNHIGYELGRIRNHLSL